MVSILLSTYNRTNGFKKSLESLVNQKVNFINYEIIVIDNSCDKYVNENLIIFNNVKNKFYNIKFTYIHNKIISGYGFPRIQAIKNSLYDYILPCEDDATYDSNYINAFYKSFRGNISIVVPKILQSKNDKNFTPNWINIEENRFDVDFTLIDYGDFEKEISKHLVFACFGFKKFDFLNSDGYGPDGFGGDYIFYNGHGENHLSNTILNDINKVALYNPKMIMYHEDRALRNNAMYFKSRYLFFGISDSFKSIQGNKFKKIKLIKLKIIFLTYISSITLFFNFIFPNLNIFKTNLFKSIFYKIGFLKHQYLFINDFNFKSYCTNKIWINYDFKKLKPIKSILKSQWD